MNLQIKDANVADIPLIQELTEQIWRPTYTSILSAEQIVYMLDMMYSTASLTRQMNEQQQHFIVLYDETRPIGFAAYGATDTDGIHKLHKIYLHSDYQGKGVGKFFIEAVMDRVKAAGAHTLELDVNRYNKARLFYERQGFTIINEKDTHIGNGYEMNDYVMQKPL